MADPPTAVHAAPATVLRFAGPVTKGARKLAVETPVNLIYGTVPYAVMMATPADLEDFALGFSLTEGVIASRADVRGIAAEPGPDGIRLRVDLVPARFHTLLARRRAMNGRTSCGICGIEDLAALPRAAHPGPATQPVHLDAIQAALAALQSHQTLNQATSAVHAAAWAGLDGAIASVREDVGRHNALDKLVGALLARDADPAQGFLLITSRCSYEMVEKAAAFGAGVLIAISAPTSLGVERAAQHGMTLAGIARHDALTVFTGGGRILAPARAGSAGLAGG